jgi:putative flippase GtrA
MSTLHQESIKLLHSQVGRFLIVGITTVLVDLIIYLLLLFFDFETGLAKALSFSSGAIFAYYANRSYTFQSKRKGLLRFILFSALYILTLTINVGVNGSALSALGATQFFIIFSFLIATTLSAVINYIGMKYIIFRG